MNALLWVLIGIAIGCVVTAVAMWVSVLRWARRR